MPVSADQAAAHRLRISTILNRAGERARDKRLNAWNYILAHETTEGSSFLVTQPEGSLYVVLGETHEIIGLPRRGGDRFHAYLNAMYGLTEREPTTAFIYDSFRAHAYQHGTHVELRRFSMYSEATKTAYLSAYNGKVWKLDGREKPELISNGDEVFFADDDRGLPIEVEIGPHGLLKDRLTGLNYADVGVGGITPEQQQRALLVWMFMLAFPDLMPTKPLLLIEGTQGAGKTAAIQFIQLALTGKDKPMSIKKNHEDDFGVLLLRSPIAMFDNTDSFIDWLPDAVCNYTTGGVMTKRKLYSDDEEHLIKPHAFIAVASKNPASFRREDVADRSLILRLERRPKFRSFKKLITEISELRAKLLGEYIWYVNRMIQEIRAGALEEFEDENSRMADFSMIARLVGRVMDWPPTAVDELMNALQNERDAFVNEEDPLVELLNKWIIYRPRVGYRAGQTSVGREITLHDLYTELESLAQSENIQWYKSPRMLMQKIRSPHVDRAFVVKVIGGDGQRRYRIWRRSDPILEVVEGSNGDV